MTIGKQIAELRKQYGLTQENVAEKCGVSRQAVTNGRVTKLRHKLIT